MIAPPLAVLRRPREDEDALPPAVLDALWRRPAGFGVDLALCRAVRADDGRTVHVVAGVGCVGLFERTGCGELWTTAQLRAGGAVAGRVERPGRLRVQGLVPDDVTALRVGLRDGARVRVPVRGGLYDVVLDVRGDGDLPDRLLMWRAGEEAVVPIGCGCSAEDLWAASR